MAQATAPGKTILFGEHAVVYGRPAIAAPIDRVHARATVDPAPPGSGITICASDLARCYLLSDAPPSDPLRAVITLALDRLAADQRDLTVTVTSTIPVARGLGSGTAVSVAIIRALAAYCGQTLADQDVSDLAYEIEKIHHGTPSGVDNTVVTYGRPVYFIRDRAIEILSVSRPFWLAVADTGISSPTHLAVNDVRCCRECDPDRYDGLFDAIGDIAGQARRAIEGGEAEKLGPLMDENQRLLEDLCVSSPELDGLIAAARRAGAGGAKLSGAGRGGNMIALITDKTATNVESALVAAGARRVILTEVK